MAKQQSKRKYLGAIVLLALLALLFLILTIVYAVKYHNSSTVKSYADVSAKADNSRSNKVYGDLTQMQYKAVRDYLLKESSFNIVDAVHAGISSNYIYSIEAIVPPKADVLNYLDNGGSEPVAKAKVTLFLGASDPKAVKEVIVYPIDKPTDMEDFVNPSNRVPSWQSRPVCPQVETNSINAFLVEILPPLTPMLKAHFGVWIDDTCDVTETCLFNVPVQKVVPGDTDRHLMILFWNTPGITDYYVWPIPLMPIVYTPGNGDNFALRSIFYDNIEYSSVQELVDAYNVGNVRDLASTAQSDFENSFGSPERRGTDVNPEDLPPPVQDTVARRFVVDDRHVEWLGWEYDFTFSPKSAVQLYNLKFNGERIAYQLGLQDVMVKYSGPEPNVAFRNYMDAAWNLGLSATPLTKGYDCPESAEYISTRIYYNGFDEAPELENIACVFEYRNHVPLRRHHSADWINPGHVRFTMSMNDIVLVFRQIVTVFNYDYIIDVEIHQSGVITSSIHPTGYIQIFRPDTPGIKYGYDLLPQMGSVGVFHTHLFDFKVDLDIGSSTANRFMTMDLESEARSHPYNPTVSISYAVLKESMKSTEQEAIIHYDFSSPRQYVVYNEQETNSRNGQHRGYRIQSSSYVNPVVPSSDPLSNLATWIHHQIAVTKYKDDEPTTLSYFSQGDPYDPLISLKYFQEDNESIVDEDLVCWVSIGVNHIPTAEDLPVTTTAGKKISFDLIPHNYYLEDPSIASRDGVQLTQD